MHREQQHRSVQEYDRETVERVVVEIAVEDGERRGPVEVRDDPERRCLVPRSHQHRANEAEAKIEENRTGEGPRDMRAHPQCLGAKIHPAPPQQDRGGQEETRPDPPAPFRQRNEGGEAPLRLRRIKPVPRHPFDEGDRVPVNRCPEVEADDLDRDKAADERGDTAEAQIGRPNLRVADLADPAIIFEASSKSFAFKSSIFFLAISFSCCLDIDPIIFLPGSFDPLFNFTASLIK